MGKFLNLTGRTFGRLTVTENFKPRHYSSGRMRYCWLCKCICGNLTWVPSHSLVQGHSGSCGCFKIERAREVHFKHGHSRSRALKVYCTPTYATWKAMHGRCSQPYYTSYPRYGGRGITVCDRWKHFEAFLQDTGERPQGTTLGRIDHKIKGMSQAIANGRHLLNKHKLESRNGKEASQSPATHAKDLSTVGFRLSPRSITFLGITS
jgi:hypothetical protein